MGSLENGEWAKVLLQSTVALAIFSQFCIPLTHGKTIIKLAQEPKNKILREWGVQYKASDTIKDISTWKQAPSDSLHTHPCKLGLLLSYRTSCSIPNVSNHELGPQPWAYNKLRQRIKTTTYRKRKDSPICIDARLTTLRDNVECPYVWNRG